MHINKQSTSQRKTENCIHFLRGHFLNFLFLLVKLCERQDDMGDKYITPRGSTNRGHFSNTALELINVPQFLWQPAGGTRPKGDRYSLEKEDNENGAWIIVLVFKSLVGCQTEALCVNPPFTVILRAMVNSHLWHSYDLFLKRDMSAPDSTTLK